MSRMIRVTSGLAKGKKLFLPKNQKTTAVKEVVKLAIFSIIGDKINGAKCLDLYAGSGNLGIEALSRGASHCTFVDISKSATETISKNLFLCQLDKNALIQQMDAINFLQKTQLTYDIIFADPYYDYEGFNYKHLLNLATEKLNPNGIFFMLTSSRKNSPVDTKNLCSSRLELQERRYGKTLLLVLTKRHQDI